MKLFSRSCWLSSLLVLATILSFAGEVIASSTPHLARHHPKHLQRAVNSRKRACKSQPPGSSPTNSTKNDHPGSGSCFPSLGYTPPSGTPSTSLDQWWCDANSESGFFGFSYGVFGCQSKSQLLSDFKKMRSTYNTRYVRVYGDCPNERANFLDDIIEAAYETGMGVFALVWLGWDASDKSWKTRMSHIKSTISNNPLAPYVIRSVDVGSEPLLDQPVDPSTLLDLVREMKSVASPKGIQVGISEMRYSYGQISDSLAKQFFQISDYVHAHELSFFSGSATTGAAAWPSVQSDLKWFVQQTGGNKKITITQTGWPTNQNEWKSASKKVDTSASSAQGYVDMLNKHCSDMRDIAGHGGVPWFWQTWSENDLSGWGLIKSDGQPQFDFNPSTSCQ